MRFKTYLKLPGTALLTLALVQCTGETDHPVTDSGSRSPLQNAATLANDTTPGNLVIDPPTLIALGFAWYITGDDNRNCTVSVQYREQGTSPWKNGMPFFRPESRPFLWGGESAGPPPISIGNLLAGSIIDLTPDTAYEVRFTLHDPDGGDATQTLTNIRTRKVPAASAAGRQLFVIPGSGGGSGTSADPFRGLQTAADAARAGDVFTLRAGTYTGAFRFKVDGTEDAPVVFRGENRDTVLFDAAGNTVWTFNFSEPFDVNDNSVTTGRRFNFLENFTLVHAKKAVRAALTTGMVLRNTVMKDFPIGSTDNKTLGPYFAGATNGYICDNAFLGPQPTLYRDADDYGPSYNIELGGTGNVVCHNVMTHWWDAITSTDSCYADMNCLANDIYNNLILYSTDDAMELDGSVRNVRALRNRMGSNYNGISTQPVYGGPIYLIRNEIFSDQAGAFKFNPLEGQDGPSGVVAYHNSVANYDRGIRGMVWSNFLFRNNILYATTGHAVYGSIMDEVDRGFDFDYNSLRPGTDGVPFRMTYLTPDPDVTVTYATIGDICSRMGNECHGGTFGSRTEEWVNVPEPTIGAGASTVSFTPDQWDFTLTGGAMSLDSGVVIPNVNDGYLGTAPDRGALERGQALPIYGPRPSGVTPTPTPIPTPTATPTVPPVSTPTPVITPTVPPKEDPRAETDPGVTGSTFGCAVAGGDGSFFWLLFGVGVWVRRRLVRICSATP